MPDLLDALGVRGARRRQLIAVSIWISFGLAMVGVAAGQAVIEDALDASTAAVCLTVATVWLGWTYWHSVAFERHRRAYLGRGMAFPYRRAFLTDIFPGITIGFSQMLRPAWNGVNLAADEVFPNPDLPADTLSLLTGVTLFALAFAVFAAAWWTLGAARVGFVREFDDGANYVAVRRGPYRHIRHPLFWSGVVLSWSLALITATTIGVLIALLNTLYGLAYNVLEDRRMQRAVGEGYVEYAQEVPRIIPRRPRPVVGSWPGTASLRRSGHAMNGSRDGHR